MVSHCMNEKDARIILYLAKNQNSMSKIIADKTNLNESNVSKYLKKLKEMEIVDYNTCPSQDGKGYTGKCWYVNSDPDTFATLLNMFVGTKDQKEFLASAYCKQMTRDWSPHCLAQAPPAQMSDSMRSVFDADKKDVEDADKKDVEDADKKDVEDADKKEFPEPSFPIDAEIVSLAVPPDDLHRIVGETIVEHATYLTQLIHRFYPKIQLNGVLLGFLYDVQRARQTFTTRDDA